MNIRMDQDLEKQAKQIFNQLGMSMTTAINIFLRQAIQERGFPFPIRLIDEVPNRETLAAMEETKAAKSNPDAKRFTSVEELFEDLDS